MQTKTYSLDIAGETLTAEFNNLADQTNGSCLVRLGNTVVMATAVMSKQEKESGYFPLTVEYEEKFYAVGKILGSQFTRREGKPSDKAILNGRIVDRTIRPLFDQYIRREIQVIVSVLSIDQHDPDVLAVIAASLALGVSDIPWHGPVSAVRILKSKNTDTFSVNPTYAARKQDGIELDMIACGKDGNINMIEVAAHESGEDTMIEALKHAAAAHTTVQGFQKRIIADIGKKKIELPAPAVAESVIALFDSEIAPSFESKIFTGTEKGMHELELAWDALVKEKIEEKDRGQAYTFLEGKINDVIHAEAIAKGRRADGRKPDQIRPLFVQAGGISPVLHGTGIFFRGGTHVMSVLTLAGPKDGLTVEGLEEKSDKRFLLHYNFPPFSTGETGKVGNTNRRMIGHGALAEKALLPMLPSKDKFPYTIRLVAESMASNGSTSMASVCAGTIALMDGGVPITRPVAGIASGLMMKSPTEYVILTDIQGPEDHHGDMDFKVAGTREGITAVQMDVKVAGVPVAILAEAFEKAKAARFTILGEIEKVICAPRPDICARAPKIMTVKIRPEQIGGIIGPGGKTINEITKKTGAEISIEQDGTIFIMGSKEAATKAAAVITEMTRHGVGTR